MTLQEGCIGREIENDKIKVYGPIKRCGQNGCEDTATSVWIFPQFASGRGDTEAKTVCEACSEVFRDTIICYHRHLPLGQFFQEYDNIEVMENDRR